MNIKNRMILALAILLYAVFVAPVFWDWNPMVKAVALLFIIQMLWIGRVFPLANTSLILVVMLSLHFFSFKETVAYLGSEAVWLLFATCIISGALLESGLAYRISLHILRWSRGYGKILLLMSFILMFILSVFIPSNVGRGSLISSILHRVTGHIDKLGKSDNLARAMFIGISYIVGISGITVATGASSTIYVLGLFNDVSPENIDYLRWMLIFSPPVLLFIVIFWLIILWFYPPENIKSGEILAYIDHEIAGLGKLKKTEIKMIAITAATVALWMLQPLHGLSIPLIGMLGALLTMLPFIGIWTWEKAKKEIDWDLMLFFASTLMVSHMLIRSGVLDWFAGHLVEHFPSGHTTLIFVALILVAMLIRVLFVNILGFMTIFIPFALVAGQHAGNTPPLLMAMAVFLAGVPGFFLITQSPIHMISYSYGHFSEKDLFRTGLASALIWFAIVLATVFVYWRYLI